MLPNNKVLTNNARIGIVNRGESALRFIRAVKEYNALYNTNLESVALYVDIEEHNPFVRQADDDFRLSSLPEYPGKQKTPYLDHELLLNALKEANCQAIWVGWGFVSEDAIFADKIEKAGIIFLGPSSKAMGDLGDKIVAKDIAEKAGVPVLPWSKTSVDTLEDAKRVSEEIGYPVIVKAANAGGGRGIRFVWTPEELEQQYTSARDETIRITGNSVVFIEYLVAKGRHLEVQVLADSHGNVNTFGVRDCSVQRKNQKIIEETPPPAFDPEVIKEIEAASARLIKAASYVGAGTVEYLYDLKTNRYFFMEVNTRLQVEHPITETLYGIDLVKGQIDVAFGKEVDLSDRKPNGWVMEVRLNAEDPDRDFSPAPGEVSLFKAPAGPGIRVDSGIEQNCDIPSEFDSMVAKIIASGPTREETMARLKRALKEMRIKIKNGTTNRAFLLELLDNPDIKKGGVHTGYVEELLKNKKSVIDNDIVELALIAGAIELYYKRYEEDFVNFQEQLSRVGRPRILPESEGYEISLSALGNSYTFLVKSVGNNIYHLKIDDKELVCQYVSAHQEGTILVNNKRYNVLIVPRGDILQCEIDGLPVILESESGGYVRSPSPAIILSTNVKPEQQVKKGDILLVLEAMKMEMLIEAPADGVVKEICVIDGAQVAAGQPLLQMEIGEQGEEEEVEKEEPVSFTALAKDKQGEWEQLQRNFLAPFLGYDTENKASAAFDEYLAFAKENDNFKEDLIASFIKAMEHYVAIERLFTNTTVTSETLARPMTHQELLSHLFRRGEDKGLPECFIQYLTKAVESYPARGLSEKEHQNYALFHIFKSHGKLTAKHDVLKKVFFALENYTIDSSLHQSVSDTIDEVIALCQPTAQGLVDAAIHTRYITIDNFKLKSIKEENYKNIEALIEKLSAGSSKEDWDTVIDAGPFVMDKLVSLTVSDSGTKGQLALEMLVRRLNRDRDVENVQVFDADGAKVVAATGKEGDKAFANLLAVVAEDTYSKGVDVAGLLAKAGMDASSEVTVLVSTNKKAGELEALFGNASSIGKADCVNLCIGLFGTDKAQTYKTYTYGSTWEENGLYNGFSPVQFRELRITRLQNFDLKTVYQTESVFLVEATSKENKKDIRLFAFVDISEKELESRDDPSRLVMLETLYMEAVYAMRAAQAQYKYRLQWNRIVIHNRALLGMRMRTMQEYAHKLLQRASDLGLEKLVVYTRRKRWSESIVRELELSYIVVAQGQYSLRNRKPSTEPLTTLDNYVTKAVRARQRNTVYPYELVKMLINSSFVQGDANKQGEFEEFDVEYTEGNKEQKIVSVKDRAPGLNDSNIVFGIITNYIEGHPVPLKRVIIMSDPTKDLGSLSEPECRRVNAALDLAEQEQIPAEWIPISSGAKINMESGTENLDWTAATLRKIINFTQNGGELNIIVPGVNVGAQSYWNAEATMLMHTKGILIMTDDASQLLTGKKALDFSGSVSGETNLDIGGAEKIMGPNGQAQFRTANLAEAFTLLFDHYKQTYVPAGETFPPRKDTTDPVDRDITTVKYNDFLGQGFETIGDIFSFEKNPERKKPFDMRQVMKSIIDTDAEYLERWQSLQDSDTAIVWESRIGGLAVGMIGIESRNLSRIGETPFDGPESWSGGTLFPMSSKKVARAINAFSGSLPLVIVANLSGFDGSPESLRRLQLEYGAEIGRAVVNFKGPIAFVVVARYHGGAYVVFSKSLNPNLKSAAIEGSYASVIGGAPAAAVVFPKAVLSEVYADERIQKAQEELNLGKCSQKDYSDIFNKIKNEKQAKLGKEFDEIHSVERAKKVGSIDDIITSKDIRPYIVKVVEDGMKNYIDSVK